MVYTYKDVAIDYLGQIINYNLNCSSDEDTITVILPNGKEETFQIDEVFDGGW